MRDLRERRRNDELVPGPEQLRGLRRIGNRHDRLAADLRGEDRAGLQLETRTARTVGRDGRRDPFLHDGLIHAAHRAHARVRTRAAHDMRTVELRQHGRRLAIDRRRDHEARLHARDAVRTDEARAHQQMLMPEHRHHRALLFQQCFQPLQSRRSAAGWCATALRESARETRASR